MKHLTLFFLLFIAFSSQAQIPNPFHKNVEQLAKKFKKKYPDDSTRVVAIYAWLNGYMRYDLKAYEKYKFKVNNYSLNKALYRRKALCYGLSKLFQDISLRSGIKNAQLQGYPLEDSADPYKHYYYDDHAWNIAFVKGRWYLFDVTYDNGFIEKRKMIVRKFMNQTFGIPLLHDKTKFVHQSNTNFIFSSGSEFAGIHYPVLINGLLISEKFSIESFEKQDSVVGDYNPSLYPKLAQLSDFAGANTAIQLKTSADQSQLFNPKNNLLKALNYYNSLRNGKKIKSDFNKSDVDTVLKYAALFKKDNNALHAMNVKRVTDEHKSLSTSLVKAAKHNNSLAILYNKNALKAIAKLKKNTEANAKNSDKIEERQLKLEEHLAGSRAKYDTLPFQPHLEEYERIVFTGDSLISLVDKSAPALDSLNRRSQELFNTLYRTLQDRYSLLVAHRAADVELMTYPVLKVRASGIDSMTTLVEYYKTQIDKTENEYNKVRQQAIRNANTGFTLMSKEYVKIKTGIAVKPPFSKDSLVANLWNRTHAFKEALVNLYHHEEELLQRQRPQFLSVAGFLKAEKKVIKKTIRVREMAFAFRLKHENSRYKAYDGLITAVAENMRNLKMTFKRKASVKKK